jgi:mannose-6-phosphate isomerase-like protein (cupin superfamily)
MTLRPGEDIGLEVHDVDQFLYIVDGEGNVILDGVLTVIGAGSAIVVPAGTEHNIRNTSSSDRMYLFTVYAPPEHADGTVHPTKADALAAEANGEDDSPN